MPGHSGIWGIAIMGFGLLLTAGGLHRALRERHWRSRAVAAEGTVIDNAPLAGGHGRVTWRPLIEFEAVGATVMALVQRGDSRRALPLGARVEVLYDPHDPHEARMATDKVRAGSMLVLGLFVVVAFLAVVTSG